MRNQIAAVLAGLIVFVAGCGRDEQAIRTYDVPKEPPPAEQTQVPTMAAMLQSPAADAPSPQGGEIHWIVPDGWKELPGEQMRYASFQVSADKPDVQLTVIPLGLEAGQLLPNVNRWENQLGLPPTAEADLGKVVKPMEIGADQAAVVDLIGPENANPRMRMLGAIVPHGQRVWFFKLAGPADVAGAQKEKFDAFLKSIHFADSPAAKPPATGEAPRLPAGHPVLPGQGASPQLPAGHPAIPGGGGTMPEALETRISSSVPQGWVQEEPRPFRAVSFQIGQGDKAAEVIVSKLPASGSGSRIDNINRWRGQVGLAPLAENQPQPSQPIKVGGTDGALFDFVGPGDPKHARHMIVAWVPRDSDWWFFKLTGPDDIVAEQQANFDAFLKSVQFVSPDANQTGGTGQQPHP